MYQLDIFADSIPVQRANDLVAALAAADPVAARRALHQLAQADPQHVDLPRFRQLCGFLEGRAESGRALRSSSAIAAEEQLLREQIVPASAVLGDAANQLLRPCWNTLAQAAEKAGLPPEQHDCFAAELYLRAHQFPAAVRVAQGIAGADFRAAAQRWLSLGFHGCGQTEQARRAALRYAWLAPQRFNALLDELGDAQFSRDWNDFQACLGELDASWFPAWCAHENRAITSRLDNLPDSAGGTAYKLVIDLQIRERGGLCPAVYTDRARLKQLDEGFFAFYMARRAENLWRTR